MYGTLPSPGSVPQDGQDWNEQIKKGTPPTKTLFSPYRKWASEVSTTVEIRYEGPL